MPELPIRKSQLTERIGHGTQRDVFAHPHSDSKIVKERHETIPESPEERQKQHLLAGMEFYLTKILHIVYPDHIPDIHMASIAQDQMQMVHDRVASDSPPNQFDSPLANKIHRHILQLAKSLTLYKDQIELQKKFDATGVSIDAKNAYNFGKNPDGTITYIDSPYHQQSEGVRSVLSRLVTGTSRPPDIQAVTEVRLAKLSEAVEQLPDTSEKRRAQNFIGRFRLLLGNYNTLVDESQLDNS